MRLFVAVLLFGALTSCDKASDEALKQAEIVERNGQPEAICEAKRAVAKAYLVEKDESNYGLRNAEAESYCLKLRLQRANGQPR